MRNMIREYLRRYRLGRRIGLSPRNAFTIALRA